MFFTCYLHVIYRVIPVFNRLITTKNNGAEAPYKQHRITEVKTTL